MRLLYLNDFRLTDCETERFYALRKEVEYEDLLNIIPKNAYNIYMHEFADLQIFEQIIVFQIQKEEFKEIQNILKMEKISKKYTKDMKGKRLLPKLPARIDVSKIEWWDLESSFDIMHFSTGDDFCDNYYYIDPKKLKCYIVRIKK